MVVCAWMVSIQALGFDCFIWQLTIFFLFKQMFIEKRNTSWQTLCTVHQVMIKQVTQTHHHLNWIFAVEVYNKCSVQSFDQNRNMEGTTRSSADKTAFKCTRGIGSFCDRYLGENFTVQQLKGERISVLQLCVLRSKGLGGMGCILKQGLKQDLTYEWTYIFIIL